MEKSNILLCFALQSLKAIPYLKAVFLYFKYLSIEIKLIMWSTENHVLSWNKLKLYKIEFAI